MRIDHVLLVDDDEVDRMRIRRMLAKTGHDVTLVEACDVRTALEALDQERFDLGLFDFRLPDGDAVDLLEALSSDADVSLPVVILTGHQDETIAQRAMAYGAQDYLLKEEVNPALLIRSMRFAFERKRTQALRRQAMHADRLQALGRLAAGVAHEVNNPATFLRANLEMMREDLVKLHSCCDRLIGTPSTPEKQSDFNTLTSLLADLDEMLDDNIEGIDRITAIASELGVFSRLKTHRPERIDVGDVVRGTLNLMRNELRHRTDITVELEAVPEIVAHRNELGQVITNLLLNAADALEESNRDQRKIVVRTRTEGNDILIEVEDNGPGVPESMRERIFDPFFTTKGPGSGTGLGLSVSSQIVEAHHGTISVQTPSGAKSSDEGTLFQVRLPVDNGLHLEEERPEESAKEGNDDRLRALLIEDDELVRRSLVRMLGQSCEVVAAAGGPEALAHLSSGADVDVIICDLMLPNMDGQQIYLAIEQYHPELLTKVVFVTGGAFTDGPRKFLESVSNIVLSKPVDQQRLLEAVKQTASQSLVEHTG